MFEVFCTGIRATSPGGTDFFRTSNFRGPCYQEALLLLGQALFFLLHCLIIASLVNAVKRPEIFVVPLSVHKCNYSIDVMKSVIHRGLKR